MKLPDEPTNLFLDENKYIGYAELYGGAGVAGNAGGVRCANVGPYQIKGIGPTRLAGRTTDKWHRHGACSLQDAVKEAIFSEVLNAALPHGTSRAIAVVPTGSNFATEIGEDKLPGAAPRALFVRQPITRLAHFLRSGFSSAPDDIKRQELSGLHTNIPKLNDALIRVSKLGSPKSSEDIELVMLGLLDLYAAQLDQVAFLQTRRLIHGSLIPSNIGIDGKLVDFTTTTAQATFDSLLVAPGGFPSERQHWQILQSIDEVVFHIAKFDSRCRLDRSAMAKWCRWIFDNASARHYASMSRAWLDIIGLTSTEIYTLNHTTRQELSDAIARVAAESRGEAALYFGGDEHRMPRAVPSRDFRNALLHVVLLAHKKLAGGKCTGTGHAAWPSGFGERLRTNLFTAYSNAIYELEDCEVDSIQPSDETIERRTAYLLSRFLRILRFTNPMERLHRRVLDGEIDLAVKSDTDLKDFINSRIFEFGNRLKRNPDDMVHLGGWATSEDVILTADHRALMNGTHLTTSEILNITDKLDKFEASSIRYAKTGLAS